MSEIGLYIFAVGAAFSFLCFIGGAAGDKSVRSALGIILIAATLSPLVGIISGGLSLEFDFDSAPAPEDDGYLAYMEEAMREGIELALEDKFSLDKSDVSVEISGFDIESMSCKSCAVRLFNSGVFADFRKIEEFCRECGAERCAVLVG